MRAIALLDPRILIFVSLLKSNQIASNTVFFENPHTGQMREAPVGFSWTTLLFGPLPMLFRSNWKWFFIILILSIMTVGLSNFVFMFIVNNLHIKSLIEDGYKAKSVKNGTLNQVAINVGFHIPQT